MAFDIVGLFKQRNGENYKLHAKYINPAWAKVTVGSSTIIRTWACP